MHCDGGGPCCDWTNKIIDKLRNVLIKLGDLYC